MRGGKEEERNEMDAWWVVGRECFHILSL